MKSNTEIEAKSLMTKRPRALLIIAHYFHPEGENDHGSTGAVSRQQRRGALERVLFDWRNLFGPTRELDWNRGIFSVQSAGVADIDIVILVYRDRHLLDEALLQSTGASFMEVAIINPRMLPFGAHALIKKNIGKYDWFIFSEDDVVPVDAGLFCKQALFQLTFGQGRLLQPNRFELNAARIVGKTYIDGDLPSHMVEQIWQYAESAEPFLSIDGELGSITFERARNPHSGFFMLSGAQASYWVQQSHFMDLDCSFVSPLESAANLSLLKTMPIYKPSGDTRWYLEVAHLDNRFSDLPWAEYPAGS